MFINIEGKKMFFTQGVLQGATSSPYLFNIYINDLLEELKLLQYNTPLAYADDIVIVGNGHHNLTVTIQTID